MDLSIWNWFGFNQPIRTK